MSDETPRFTERQIRTLAAVCDTFAPALDIDPDPHGFYARGATEMGLAPIMAETIEAVSNPSSLAQVKLILDLLDQSVVNAMFGGAAVPFAEMTLDQRTAVLRHWADSRFGLRRGAFQGFKRLALYLFYSVLDKDNCNSNWQAIGYSGPPPPAGKTEKPLQPLALDKDTTLKADVVVVGSGAGGGVVAGELSAAGLDVIVLEKGDYYAEPNFDGYELSSGARMFERRGLLATADLGVVILAGSTLGGGTTINWCASLRTPDHVLAEWESDYGVTGYTGKDYQKALDAVSKRINVNERECAMNAQNAALARGGEALNFTVKRIPRNVNGCDDCGFCNFGCPFAAKQGTLRTYLRDAHDRGARIVVRSTVNRVITSAGKAVGIEGTVLSRDGRPVNLTVQARVVVVSAGSLHTPVLLMRSGLTNANIGRNLHLHPTTAAFGVYESPIRGWSGVMMSRYISDFTNLDGEGYGVVLETAPVHPGIAGSSLPWLHGHQHKTLMGSLEHMGNILAITRDHDGGRITVDRGGHMAIHYSLSERDKVHLLKGVIEALRVHHAAGAEAIFGPHGMGETYHRAAGNSFDDFLHNVEAAQWRTNSFLLASAHQMSSCRMGSNPTVGALDPTGETFEVRNLFAADGSVLPTASGVNPMLTIMAVSQVIAQHVKVRLTK